MKQPERTFLTLARKPDRDQETAYAICQCRDWELIES
jgi:hypothetical protein